MKSRLQSILRDQKQKIKFVHCPSHLLQLALIKGCDSQSDVKRAISFCNVILIFSLSPTRLRQLPEIESSLDT